VSLRERTVVDATTVADGHNFSTVKPRPRQEKCRSNIVECYKLNDSFDKVETNWAFSICFDFVERTKFYQENSFAIVAKNGNNVEATFDFVEPTFDFVEQIVGPVAVDNVASKLLLVWTGLKSSE